MKDTTCGIKQIAADSLVLSYQAAIHHYKTCNLLHIDDMEINLLRLELKSTHLHKYTCQFCVSQYSNWSLSNSS